MSIDETTTTGTTTFQTEQLGPAITTIVSESKKGYKTTEFWVAIVVSLLTVLDGIPLPEKFEGALVGALGVAYAISRGLAKQGVPVVEPAPAPPA